MTADLVDWLNQEQDVHPVLVSGISQFQFVHIHPFLDGNGRTSRLLSTLCLYRAGYDFKRLFTISEYYDRDRQAFYRAIQGVREAGMDMTGWLEYFVEGLTAKLAEVREHGRLTIQDFEGLWPDVNRRSLQRDLKAMVDRGLIVTEGETHQLLYRLAEGA